MTQQQLHGRLLVLLAMRDELVAIGASRERREHNRSAIAETLAALRIGNAGGDLADATPCPRS
jgi:hypothetical protein